MIIRGITLVIIICIYLLGSEKAIAGSGSDYGTAPGTPPIGSFYWVAWDYYLLLPAGSPRF